MKSHSKAEQFALKLLFKVLDDSSYLVKKPDLERDKSYIARRVACEGFSFLSKTLPRFVKAVLVGIENGAYVPPMGFAPQRDSLLPAFMRGWTTRIFDSTGLLVAQPDHHSFQELVQVCMLLYKLELPHTCAEESLVVSRFIQNELEIKALVLPDSPFDRDVLSLARELLSQLLAGVNYKDIRPRHGPGSVATRERGNAKYRFVRKYQRLHSKYPYYEYFSPSLGGQLHGFSWYRALKPELNPVAKVVLVPKDSRGPRLISMEPLEIQWIQQGLMRLVTARVEKHNLTRGKVSFEDQSLNQDAALAGSISRKTATLDLKDASDRVSLTLFRYLFPKECVESFEACRSVATILPDGRMQSLAKFAPMGSALCFPVLALTVWALVEATLRLQNLSTDDVRVFGDDLIVPSNAYSSVCLTLSRCGLLVNTDKSFVLGPFRESCGCDAFNGTVVTPTRLKKIPHSSHPDYQVLSHLIELSDAFFVKGYWSTCHFLREEAERVHARKLPWTASKGFLGYYCPDHQVALSRNRATHKVRWNADLQRHEVFATIVKPVKDESPCTHTWRLLKGLTGLYSESGESHQVTLRGTCTLKQRWCAA